MPWTATLCPDNTVKDFNDCLACTHECTDLELREALIERQTNWQAREHTGSHITATTLLGCLRANYLERVTPFAERPEHMWWSLRGELIHRLVERPDMDNPYLRRSEMRLQAQVDGTEVSGRIDNYQLRFLERGVLKDWKSIGDNGLQYVIYEGAKEEHVWQANIYAWLLRQNGYRVDAIEIVYLSLMQIVRTGHPATLSEFLVTAPTASGKRRHMIGDPRLVKEYASGKKKWDCAYAVPPVPVHDDAAVLEFMRPRVAALRDAFELGVMPPMAGDETRRWKCADYCRVSDLCELYELGHGHGTGQGHDLAL